MRGRWRRFAAITVVVLVGFATGVVLAGPAAFGDTVTGTTGDISYSATWTQGPSANQTTLTLNNTAASGGQTISEFYFTLGAGTITNVSGSPSACSFPQPNQVYCGGQIMPGQTETVTITSQAPIGNGTNGTLKMYDSSDSPQPVVP